MIRHTVPSKKWKIEKKKEKKRSCGRRRMKKFSLFYIFSKKIKLNQGCDTLWLSVDCLEFIKVIVSKCS